MHNGSFGELLRTESLIEPGRPSLKPMYEDTFATVSLSFLLFVHHLVRIGHLLLVKALTILGRDVGPVKVEQSFRQTTESPRAELLGRIGVRILSREVTAAIPFEYLLLQAWLSTHLGQDLESIRGRVFTPARPTAPLIVIWQISQNNSSKSIS